MLIERSFEQSLEDVVDWDTTFVWVNRSGSLYAKLPVAADAKVAVVVRDDGVKLNLTPRELDKDYFVVEVGTKWKPRYCPKKARYFQQATALRSACGKSFHVEAGGALLCDQDGQISVVAAAEYTSCYVVVGFPGTPYPVTPFNPHA